MSSSDVFIIITVILFLIALMVIIGLTIDRRAKIGAIAAAEEFGTNVSVTRGGMRDKKSKIPVMSRDFPSKQTVFQLAPPPIL